MSRLEGGEDKQQDGGEAGDGEREKKKVGAAVVRVEGADVALLVSLRGLFGLFFNRLWEGKGGKGGKVADFWVPWGGGL